MKLSKKIALAAVGATMAITLSVGLSLNSFNQKSEKVNAAGAGVYTYDFAANFATYASTWGTNYTSHTVSSIDLGTDLPAATFDFSSCNKQNATITTMPVSKKGNLVFTLNETGYAITEVSITFIQWNKKANTILVHEGSTTSGEQLYNGNAGLTTSGSAGTVGTTGNLTVVSSNVNSIYVENKTDNQVGWNSISVTIVQTASDTDIVDAFVRDYMHPEISYNIGDLNSGACLGATGYYAIAKTKFNTLSSDQRELFVSNTAYAEPYARLLAWADANGDAMSAGNVLDAASSNHLNIFENANHSMTAVLIISAASIVALSTFLLLRKKKTAKY